MGPGSFWLCSLDSEPATAYEKPGFCDLSLRFDVSTPSEVDFETLSEQCFLGGAPGKLAARLTSCEPVFEKLGLIFCIPSPYLPPGQADCTY